MGGSSWAERGRKWGLHGDQGQRPWRAAARRNGAAARRDGGRARRHEGQAELGACDPRSTGRRRSGGCTTGDSGAARRGAASARRERRSRASMGGRQGLGDGGKRAGEIARSREGIRSWLASR